MDDIGNHNTTTKGEKLAVNIKKAGVAAVFFRILRTALFSVILIALAVLFLYIEIPRYVSAAMIFAAVFIVAVDIIRLKRTAQIELNTPDNPEYLAIELEPGEILMHTIPAVMQFGKNRSVEVLGTGRVRTPENALLLTTKSLWALTVPLPGNDTVVSGMDIGKWQWMYAYESVIDMLQVMLETLPLEAVFIKGNAKRLMRLEEIKRIKIPAFTYAISITGKNGKKIGYSIRRKADFLSALEAFGTIKGIQICKGRQHSS